MTGIEDSGFTRNWWVGLSMFHTVFARHHNTICDGLKAAHPQHPWTSDQLFKTARLINAAVIAKIHTVEWTPAVLPNDKVVSGLCTNWWGLIETKRKPFGKRTMRSHVEVNHPVLGGLVGGKRPSHSARHQFSEQFVSAYRLHTGLTDTIGIRPVGRTEPTGQVNTDATRGHGAHQLVRAHGIDTLFHSFGLEKGGALINNNLPNWAVDMSIDGQSVFDIGTDGHPARPRARRAELQRPARTAGPSAAAELRRPRRRRRDQGEPRTRVRRRAAGPRHHGPAGRDALRPQSAGRDSGSTTCASRSS